MGVIHEGTLTSSGREYVIVETRRKAWGLWKGVHHIVTPKDKEVLYLDLEREEMDELKDIAYDHAWEVSPDGRFRVDNNGPKVGRMATCHWHCIFPEPGDELLTIVSRGDPVT